jgi:hypothetical protein
MANLRAITIFTVLLTSAAQAQQAKPAISPELQTVITYTDCVKSAINALDDYKSGPRSIALAALSRCVIEDIAMSRAFGIKNPELGHDYEARQQLIDGATSQVVSNRARIRKNYPSNPSN